MTVKNFFVAAVIVAAGFSASYAAAPDGYYESCENKGGRTLLTALAAKVGPHKAVSYEGLWEVYKTSDVRDNGRVWDMYSTKEWVVGQQKCGNYKKVGDCINREHSFPKSWFDDAKPMYSDAFHLYPTDGKVNGQRSNFPYGECAGGTREPDNGGVHALGKLGNSTFPGYTGKVFEPDDEYKGDFARSYFYMATAYNDRIATWSSPMLAKNSFPAFSSWAVNLLLKWHRQDPVSEKEIKRNDAVYAHQNNRNPYIDHPELVEYIWGNKSSEKWTSTIASDPIISLPADGSTVDMGLTGKNVSLSRAITVRTINVKDAVTLSFNGREFEVSPASIPAATANASAGTTATVTFTASAPGSYSEQMTVACGTLVSHVTFTATVVDGLPVAPASNVSDQSFDVTWTYIGDADAAGKYTLSVMDASGSLLSGYPLGVDARAGRYTVGSLAPSADYTFVLKSQSYTSETQRVRTADPIPEVDFFFEGDLHLASEPGVVSPEAELWIETDNVDTDYTVEVKAPFQLSLDKTEWATKLTLSPEDDRVYLRVFSTDEGDFESSIVALVGDHRIDDAVVTATIRAPKADFVETFENYPDGMGSYDTPHTYQGTACLWHLEDTGMWTTSDDRPYSGEYALRGGKNGKGVIEMLEDHEAGIGMLRFWAHVWKNDVAPVFDVMLSTNAGVTWDKVGSITLEGQDYREYSCPVNSQGRSRIKLVQTAGKRYLLDDLSLTSHTTGLADPTEEHNRWDAWSPAPGCLTVSSAVETEVSVYAVNGLVLASGRAVGPMSPLTFEGLAGQEVYIVVAGDFSRRVYVR